MVAVVPWTAGHQGGSLGCSHGKLGPLRVCQGSQRLFQPETPPRPPGQDPSAGLGIGMLNSGAPGGPLPPRSCPGAAGVTLIAVSAVTRELRRTCQIVCIREAKGWWNCCSSSCPEQHNLYSTPSAQNLQKDSCPYRLGWHVHALVTSQQLRSSVCTVLGVEAPAISVRVGEATARTQAHRSPGEKQVGQGWSLSLCQHYSACDFVELEDSPGPLPP